MESELISLWSCCLENMCSLTSDCSVFNFYFSFWPRSKRMESYRKMRCDSIYFGSDSEFIVVGWHSRLTVNEMPSTGTESETTCIHRSLLYFFSTSLFCCNINVFPPYFKLLTVTDIIKFVVFLVPTLNLPVYITLPFYRTIFPTIAVVLLFFLLMLYVFVCSTLSNLSFESGGCVRAYNARKKATAKFKRQQWEPTNEI